MPPSGVAPQLPHNFHPHVVSICAASRRARQGVHQLGPGAHTHQVHCNTHYAHLRADILDFLLGMHARSLILSRVGEYAVCGCLRLCDCRVCVLWASATVRLSSTVCGLWASATVRLCVGVCDCRVCICECVQLCDCRVCSLWVFATVQQCCYLRFLSYLTVQLPEPYQLTLCHSPPEQHTCS